MATAALEHTNFTVSDPAATAAWMTEIFGWHIRWQGEATQGGSTIHVGTKDHYLALYTPPEKPRAASDSYRSIAGLNHIAVVVDDLAATEAAVKAHGFATGPHYDYEPGHRFYFHDADGIEFEVVAYD